MSDGLQGNGARTLVCSRIRGCFVCGLLTGGGGGVLGEDMLDGSRLQPRLRLCFPSVSYFMAPISVYDDELMGRTDVGL